MTGLLELCIRQDWFAELSLEGCLAAEAAPREESLYTSPYSKRHEMSLNQVASRKFIFSGVQRRSVNCSPPLY
jgi:hypothetical protein